MIIKNWSNGKLPKTFGWLVHRRFGGINPPLRSVPLRLFFCIYFLCAFSFSVFAGPSIHRGRDFDPSAPGEIGDRIPAPANFGGSTGELAIDENGVVTLSGDAKRELRMRPTLNQAAVGRVEKPIQIDVGVFQGFSLPIWSTPVNADEQLSYEIIIPARWDGASDFIIPFDVALGGAEDVGDKFQLQLDWENDSCGSIIPATSNPVTVEVTIGTGENSQYQCFCVEFVIDYDIDGEGNEVQPGDMFAGRLRRIAASTNEVTNEIIIRKHMEIDQIVDKIFGTW